MQTIVVRLVHLVGMALLLGGAVTLWVVFRRRPDVALARTYEAAFWGLVGAMVVTGIGNLGALAPAIPRVGTPRGSALAVKLGLVAGVLVYSVGRTVLVTRAAAGAADASTTTESHRLRLHYAATSLALVAVVVLAVVVARGG